MSNNAIAKHLAWQAASEFVMSTKDLAAAALTAWPSIVDVSPVKRENVTPKEYLKLAEHSPHLIARARFAPPRPGGKGFGTFEVEYSVPVLKRSGKS